jgi:serine phosphatase RsbU (regulator of sigma subunit)
VPASSLVRLLDRDALQAILDAVANIGGEASLEDLDGRTIARATTGGANGAGGAGGPRAEREIRADDAPIARVTVRGPGAEGLAEIVARSLELALGESVVRRNLAGAALETYRELALLYRIGETIGTCLDAGQVAPLILSEVDRVLRPSTSIVRSGSGSVPVLPAEHGDLALVPALDEAARDLIARIESGGAADLAEPADGPFGSLIAAPLRTGGGHHGVVVLGRTRASTPFVAGDLKLLGAIAAHAAIAFERADLHQSDGARQRLEEELAIGRRIQLALMPNRFPALAGWEFAAAYEAAREVGGDFYDVFSLRQQPDSVGIVVADVTGKGIPSALLMADARALVHAAADTSPDPAESLRRVNRILVSERAVSLFITVFHAVIDGPRGLVRYASAGHEPTILVRADGGIEFLEAPGILIGVTLQPDIEWREATLEPGDTIVAYTDGITEARDPAGGFYGEERLIELAGSLSGRSAAEVVQAILDDVRAFRGSAEPSDDVTLLVARRISRGESPAVRAGRRPAGRRSSSPEAGTGDSVR